MLNIVIRHIEPAKFESDRSVPETLQLAVQKSVNVECEIVQHFRRLSPLGREQNAPNDGLPLSWALGFGLALVMLKEPAPIDRLAASIHGERRALDAQASNPNNIHFRSVRDQIDQSEPVDLAMQSLDLLFDLREISPQLPMALLALLSVCRPVHRAIAFPIRPVCMLEPFTPRFFAVFERLDIHCNTQLRDHQAAPCRECEGGPVRREADSSDRDFDAMARGECDSPQARVSHALYGYASEDPEDRKDDECE